MMRLAVENTPAEAAWAVFDAAAIAFHRMYGDAANVAAEPGLSEGPEGRAQRMKAAEEVARLWDEWRALFLADSGPRPAA
jgi:hypothetical protein